MPKGSLLARAWKKITRPQVDFGSFDSVEPISLCFGFDRGLPIDRYYIERFLAHHAGQIGGRVLEIGDDSYSRRFGGDRITQQDVLHVHGGNPAATIVGDLSAPDLLPEDAFDCLVITQTLHLIYDMRTAVEAMHRALKPGGVVLLTVPGISQIARDEWGTDWFWSLTKASASRLFGEVFGPDQVSVRAHGNVFAATAFLQGVATHEVSESKLDVHDESYPVVVTVKARKAVAA